MNRREKSNLGFSSMSFRQPYQLYSGTLTEFCHRNQANLSRLRSKILEEQHCSQYGTEQWHLEAHKVMCKDFEDDTYDSKCRWENHDVLFTGSSSLNCSNRLKYKPVENGKAIKELPNSFCYLCTTLEEHERHLARRGLRLKKPKKVKPRVEFIVPLPVNRIKKEEEEADPEEILFKVSVKTASQPNAGTDANVYITLHSGKYSTQKHQLKKKMAWVQFHFGKGTNEVFFFKGPNIGDLKYITVEHDGIEKKHGWLLKEIKVTNMAEKRSWLFPCQQWLSLYEGDFCIKRHLPAVEIDSRPADYEVKISTGNKKMAGTDSNVFITLYGKKGVSPKLKLLNENSNKDCFKSGREDDFILETEDIGYITRIRIERDQKGKNAGWFLEKVTIMGPTGKPSLFICYDWLTNKNNGNIYKDLWVTSPKSVKEVMKKIQKQETSKQLKYEVSTFTGDLKYAGTDANVYLKMVGKNGASQETRLCSNSASFERGRMDTFQISANDVGPLNKITIRHDNSGLGAGWFLEKVIIKRYFPKDEVQRMLKSMGQEGSKNRDEKTKGFSQDSNQRLRPDDRRSIDSESSGDEEIDTFSRRKFHRRQADFDDEKRRKYKDSGSKKGRGNSYRGLGGSYRHEADSDSEALRQDDDDDDDDNEPIRQCRLLDSELDTASSDSADDHVEDAGEEASSRASRKRVPVYEEYVFPCGHWLARDEEEGVISRNLKLSSVTTIYKINKK